MKKILIFAATTAVVLASCARTEDTLKSTSQGDALTFGVYVPKNVTKAYYGNQTTTTLQTDGFGVLAYYTGDNGSADGAYSASATPNFMYNTKVSTASWTYSPLKYWPNEHGSNATSDHVDKLSFFAYAPWTNVTNLATGSTGLSEGITSLTGNAATGDPKISFTIPAKGSEQVDLLWGVAAADAPTATAQVSPTNTITAGKPFIDLTKQECDGKVKYVFKHALAKLDFKVQAIVDDDVDATLAVSQGEDPAKTKVFVRKVEVTGKFNTSSTLNLNNTTANVPLWTTPTTTNAGTSPIFVFNDGLADADDLTADGDESTDIAAAFINGAGVTNTAQKLLASDREFFIIPVDLSTQGVKVTVTYDIETTDPNLAGTLTDGTTKGIKIKNKITTKTPALINFEAGKWYTIVLKLGLTSVKMEAEVENWDQDIDGDDDVDDDDVTPIDLPKNVD